MAIIAVGIATGVVGIVTVVTDTTAVGIDIAATNKPG
jgi:hypothetical protein